MNKQLLHSSGKISYLLGIDKDNAKVWLEDAVWDCSWYWGFGYMVTYNISKTDITSHTHFNSLFKEGKITLSDNGIKTPLSAKEEWELAELMKSFYILREAADLLHRGGTHISNNPASKVLKLPKYSNHINKVLLPAIFKSVFKILQP